jgi:cytochrome c oxidase assembly factor CtaG/polyferredoxin
VDTIASAAFRSWSFDPHVIIPILLAAIIYVRGWLRLRRVLPSEFSDAQLASFLSGLALVFIAIESPLDSFSSLLLGVHMVQHLLLMMIAPPLILYGQPMLPLLRGLPRQFVRDALGPFLRWNVLRGLGAALISPAFAWAAYNVSTAGWHLPALYELALSSPPWHRLEHACFFWTAILFWWPVIQPWPSRPRWNRWIVVPYLLLSDIVNTAVAATFIFADKILYPSYANNAFSGINPRTDQSFAGGIMWVPGSMLYLFPAVIIAVHLVGGEPRRRATPRPPGRRAPIQRTLPSRKGFDLLQTPLLGPALRWKYSRRIAQTLMLLIAIAVVLDGFLGPQMAPMNLAGVLPWIHWRGLVIVALLIAGNFFCMACPFMLPRELAKHILPARFRWPARLRSKWLAAGLLILYLWAYEAFSLWNSPAWTAWIVIGYFVAAFAIDGLFRGAAFCKYVCPIGQFNFIHSLVSPFEVKIREEKTCQSCQTHDCIRGNATQRGCELYLFQPKKESNLDCTFCLDCVSACPHDNVGILAVPPARTLAADPYRSSLGRLSKRLDVAALALLLVFGAFANAAGMIAPLVSFEGTVASMLPRPVLILILAAFGLLVVPAALILFCTLVSRRLAGRTGTPWRILTASFGLALVPLGFAMWAAHFAYHLAAGWLTAIPVLQRSWADLFGLSTPIHWSLSSYALVPSWLTPLQILLLDAGLLLTLCLVWRISLRYASGIASRLRLAGPWGALACALYAAGIWILFQPMQMRGTMMMH